jgi:hypothetical protein
VIAWLLEGDPCIRWQVMRDLLDAPPSEWEEERAKVPAQGVGKKLLEQQDPEGTWGQGIYSPKWTSTTYTLLLLRDMGLDRSCKAAYQGAQLIVDSLNRSTTGPCTCIKGMWLALGARFGVEDPTLHQTVEHLLTQQMKDGGWNCRWPRIAKTHHSSFHTTFNVLDGIREAIESGIGSSEKLKEAEDKAIELMLIHRMFRSDKTGKLINPAFTQLHFPYRWHYDILRGLDYIRTTPHIKDPRLDDAFQILLEQSRPDGRWPAAKTYGGKVFFPIENGRDGSRWNTLRALRCLKARGLQ